MEFCCSYVKLPYHCSFYLGEEDYHVSRTFYTSYWTMVLPTEANSSSCDSDSHYLILSYVLRTFCTAHPNLSFYWLQNPPSPQVISHRLLVNPCLNFVTETQAFSNFWALLRFCTTPKLQAFQYPCFGNADYRCPIKASSQKQHSGVRLA